jgi:hypothetical protein
MSKQSGLRLRLVRGATRKRPKRQHTGKTIVAMPLNSAVRRHTAKISLPCDRSMVHGNETGHGKGPIGRTATSSARQRGSRAHDKEKRHGKERSQHTAKNHRTVKDGPAHGKENSHGKGGFAVRQTFAMCIQVFSFFFIFVLFFLLLMFISQLVLYFVDYILVLLNTMCIYPDFCNTTYSTLSSPPYQGFGAKHASGNFLKCYHMCANGVVTSLR